MNYKGNNNRNHFPPFPLCLGRLFILSLPFQPATNRAAECKLPRTGIPACLCLFTPGRKRAGLCAWHGVADRWLSLEGRTEAEDGREWNSTLKCLPFFLTSEMQSRCGWKNIGSMASATWWAGLLARLFDATLPFYLPHPSRFLQKKKQVPWAGKKEDEASYL